MERNETGLSDNAIQLLVDSHKQFLAFLEKRVESRAVAEDILQSAFVRGLERGSEIRDEENVVAWFYRLLRNAVIDHYRRRASRERAHEAWGRDLVSAESPDAVLRAEICECVSKVLLTLKPEYREALQVVDLAEGRLEDLARQSNITTGNAGVRVHRAREALKKQLQVACGTCAEHGCLECECC